MPEAQVIADLAGRPPPVSPRWARHVSSASSSAPPIPRGVAADWLARRGTRTPGSPARRRASADRGDRRPLAARPARHPADRVVRARHRLPDGARDGLAAARNRVLGRRGPRRGAHGLIGAPRIRVLAGEERHVTVDRALRLLGFGTDGVEPVEVDAHGAMRADALEAALAIGEPAPTIVVAQVGNVNTGASDPMREVCAAREGGGRLGARRRRVRPVGGGEPRPARTIAGTEHADSWATDGHKWLQVPYDCGIAFVRDREAHRAAMARHRRLPRPGRDRPARADGLDARVLAPGARAGGLRDPALARPRAASPSSWTACARAPSASPTGCRRRVRGDAHGLNQVLVALGVRRRRRTPRSRRSRRRARAGRAARPGAARRCIRISVCSRLTTFDDVDRSVAAMAAAAGR